MLLYVSLVQFRTSGSSLDLFVGVAFGTLAVGNIFVKLLPPVMGLPVEHQNALLLLMFLRLLAAGLFLLSLMRLDEVVPRSERRGFALRLVGATIGLVGIGSIAIMAAGDVLPPAVSPETSELLERDAVIVRVLPGQAWWLLLTSGALAAVMLIVVVGYLLEAQRTQDSRLNGLALPLMLLTIGHFHSLAFPPIHHHYISIDGTFRIAGYMVLLLSLLHQWSRDIVDRTAQEERLSLSRDLHDGLMQQLSLLNLRLNCARSSDRSEERRASDLDASAHLLESAMLEARQVITALRVTTVEWADMARTLDAFADEFSRNHEVVVDVRASSASVSIEAGLQADLLRIVQEACSNAIRHGEATNIWIDMTVVHGSLELRITDDGRGFDPQSNKPRQGANGMENPTGQCPFVPSAARGGVGLHSMSERADSHRGTMQVHSTPGDGTIVRVCMPVSGGDG
jgi:signal transduction histidine kinase